MTRWERRVTTPFVLRGRWFNNRSTCLDSDATVFSLMYKMMRSPPWRFASSPPWHPSTSCQRQCRPSRLRGNSTESSSSDMDESRVALLDFVCLAHERGDCRCLYETKSSNSGVIPKFGGMAMYFASVPGKH